jgi:hypothetical protein
MGGASVGCDKSQPHSPQNLSSGRFSKLHFGHFNESFSPHSRQNFLVSALSVMRLIMKRLDAFYILTMSLRLEA